MANILRVAIRKEIGYILNQLHSVMKERLALAVLQH